MDRMPRVEFDSLPDAARLWIFAAERELTPAEHERLVETVDAFLERWQAHGRPLVNARDLRYSRFLLIGVDEQAAGASGCSIDALVREIKRLEAEWKLVLLDHAPVLFRDGAAIRRVSRDVFADLAREGRVTPETEVFDNTLTTVADLRRGRWQVPASASWHGQAFF
jgi:hypothetical protein